MSTEVALQYKNKVFPQGQFKKLVLKLCRFLNILPADCYVFLRQKDQDFEISSKITVDELDNIRELGTTVSRLDLHYNYNIITLSCKSCSDVLNVLYIINGNMKYSEKFIFFVENVLEITRFSEEISELSNGQFLAIDKSVLKLMKQVYEKETENTMGWTLEKYLHQVIREHCVKRSRVLVNKE